MAEVAIVVKCSGTVGYGSLVVVSYSPAIA
jgi:hypothetical protein